MVKLTLEAARVNAHLTQEEAAKMLGISRKTMQNWEKGKTYPATKYLTALCTLYGVPLDVLNFLPFNST